MKSTGNTISVKWAVIVLGVIVVLVAASIAALSLRPEKKVTDFESCKAAGGTILEMYPEQCRINGNSYTNEAQIYPENPGQSQDGSEYIGLTEEEALTKAKRENVTARVVERDDEMLPVTMDFMFGRHNLHIKDSVVYKVEIEGQASDDPGITDGRPEGDL